MTVTDFDYDATNAQLTVRIHELEQELENTRTELREANAQHDIVLGDKYQLEVKLSQAEQRHQQDIVTIGDRLIAEAEERNWCETYDNIVEEINEQLHKELQVRRQTVEWEVSFRVSLTAQPGQLPTLHTVQREIRSILEDCTVDDCDTTWGFINVDVARDE